MNATLDLSSVRSLPVILDAVHNAPFSTISQEERVVLTRMLVAVERSLASAAYPIACDLLRTIADRVEQDANVHVLAGNEAKQVMVREIARSCSIYASRLAYYAGV